MSGGLNYQAQYFLEEIFGKNHKYEVVDGYYDAYATKRNDKKHQNATKLLWAQSLQWIDGKKISAEDLEIEISQMLPAIA